MHPREMSAQRILAEYSAVRKDMSPLHREALDKVVEALEIISSRKNNDTIGTIIDASCICAMLAPILNKDTQNRFADIITHLLMTAIVEQIQWRLTNGSRNSN